MTVSDGVSLSPRGGGQSRLAAPSKSATVYRPGRCQYKILIQLWRSSV